jgi:hypothetical protein
MAAAFAGLIAAFAGMAAKSAQPLATSAGLAKISAGIPRPLLTPSGPPQSERKTGIRAAMVSRSTQSFNMRFLWLVLLFISPQLLAEEGSQPVRMDPIFAEAGTNPPNTFSQVLRDWGLWFSIVAGMNVVAKHFDDYHTKKETINRLRRWCKQLLYKIGQTRPPHFARGLASGIYAILMWRKWVPMAIVIFVFTFAAFIFSQLDKDFQHFSLRLVPKEIWKTFPSLWPMIFLTAAFVGILIITARLMKVSYNNWLLITYPILSLAVAYACTFLFMRVFDTHIDKQILAQRMRHGDTGAIGFIVCFVSSLLVVFVPVGLFFLSSVGLVALRGVIRMLTKGFQFLLGRFDGVRP